MRERQWWPFAILSGLYLYLRCNSKLNKTAQKEAKLYLKMFEKIFEGINEARTLSIATYVVATIILFPVGLHNVRTGTTQGDIVRNLDLTYSTLNLHWISILRGKIEYMHIYTLLTWVEA